MHHPRPAEAALVGYVIVGLENAREGGEELLWPFASAAHAKIEDRPTARRSVLPEVGLMVLTTLVVRLHIDRGFVGLEVTTGQQLPAHGPDHRGEHLADRHHPAAHRGPRDLDAHIAQQDGALTIEWAVIGILADDGVDNHLVGHQALVDDARWKRRHGDALLLAPLAGAFLALDDLDVILGRLDLQHFAVVVADHFRFRAALSAHALLGRASDDLLHARQICGKGLPAGMRAPLPLLLAVRCRQLLALALHLNFLVRDPGLFLQ